MGPHLCIEGPNQALSNGLQERAWYDAHRSTVLATGYRRSTAQQPVTPSPFSDLKLQEHQSPTAFSGFDDSPQGFYTIYSTLFKRLHSQERAAAEAAAEKLSMEEAPVFGTSQASHSAVLQFYSFWSCFQTVKDFAWLDLHDPQAGTGRNMRRILQAENNKVRKAGKVAIVKDVRNLVEWVHSEDRRVQKAQVR
jgi:DnaJ homolog subfamily A member 5